MTLTNFDFHKVIGIPGPAGKNATPGVELLPYDLDFHEVNAGTLPGPFPASMVSIDEGFTDATLTRFTTLSEGTPLVPVISGGHITFTNTAGQNTGLQEGVDLTVPQFAVSIHIDSVTTTSGNAYENFGRGYAKDSNNYVMAVWRKIDGLASIQVKIGGTSNFRGNISVSWTPPFDIGLSLVANTLIFWQRPDNGAWTKICSYDVSGDKNFKTSSLTGWKSVFWVATDSAHTCTPQFSASKTGSFGGTSIRDICPVTLLDGTPAFAGSVVTCTATLTDPTGAAYCGVITYDVIAKTLTQTAVLFVNRSSAIQNDGAAHIIQDGGGHFHLFITTWGNAGGAANTINILYKHETSLNLMTGINVVASMTQPTMPNVPSLGGTYDPFAALIGSTWYLAFTYGPNSSNAFYPGLASSADLTTWTAVGQDTTAVPFEGTRIAKLGNAFTVLASTVVASAGTTGAAGATYVRAYDLTMSWVGNIYPRGFLDVAANSYPPHCSLLPYGNYVYWLTFDNSEISSVNGTQGQFRVFRAWRYGAAGS